MHHSMTRPRLARTARGRAATLLAATTIAASMLATTATPAVGHDPRDGGAQTVLPNLAHMSLADQPESVTSTCLWGMPLGPLDSLNILAPDTNVGYWYNRFDLPAGARVVLHGEFPHARFMSLTTYGTVAGQRGTALGGLSDVEIDPDPGSKNPFRPGTLRIGRRRSFTVTLSGDVDPGPGNRAANTYVGQAGQTADTQTIELVLRIYRPDIIRDMAGGVALPTPTLVLADGTAATGQDACDTLQVQSGIDKLDTTGMGVAPSTYLSLLSLPGAAPTHPAVDPIRFNRYFNPQWSLASFFRGTALESRIETLPTDLRPGFYATPANAYVSAYADRTFGPNPAGHNLLVLRGKLPTHPTTFYRNPFNNTAGKQVRYWSLCNYGSAIANPPLGPANTDCLFDEQIPTDRDGNFEIVVSLPRTAHATPSQSAASPGWTGPPPATASPEGTTGSSCSSSANNSPTRPSLRASTRC